MVSNKPGEMQRASGEHATAPTPITDTPIRVGDADEQVRLFIEGVSDYGIFLLDSYGRIATWNIGAQNILGYTESEILGQHVSLIFELDERMRDEPGREMTEAEATGHADEECWHVRKDGSRFWGSGMMIAVNGPTGELYGFCKVIRDLTQRHQAEEEARASAERDRRIADALQQAMLIPLKEEQFPGFAVASPYEAAWEEALVGGDFLDGFPVSESLVAFAVGDASGKGLEAAVRTTQIKDVLRAFLRSREEADAAQTLTRLNEYLCRSKRLENRDDEGFVTLSLAIVDTATGEATFASAGAEPSVVLRANGELEKVELHALPLGCFPDAEYSSKTLSLASGDTLLLLTDGVTEARRGPDFISPDELAAIIRAAGAADPAQMMGQVILNSVKVFAGGKLHDDACMVIARRL